MCSALPLGYALLVEHAHGLPAAEMKPRLPGWGVFVVVAPPLLQSCWESLACISQIGVKGRELQAGTGKKAAGT